MRQIVYADGVTRLDVLLANEARTRSQAARLIASGCVRVAGVVVDKASFKPAAGQEIVVEEPDPASAHAQAQDIPLTILYQDADLACVYKPVGMVVHPAAGNQDGTLVNALLYHLDHLSGIGGEKRPGIVHRLDKDTSGLLLVAKNDRAHAALSRQLAERKMEKHYFAVVAGSFQEAAGEINAPIARSLADRKKMAVRPGGREAITQWRMVRTWPDKTLLDIHLITGRTHQIRVHMAHIHHPVLGDQLYGHKHMPAAPRLMLHAYSLAFEHPISGQHLSFILPADACFGVPR